MTILRVMACLLMGATALPRAEAQQPRVTDTRLASDGKFEIQAAVPAGHRHIVLEWSDRLASPVWRSMIASSLDGREARVDFYFPRPNEWPAGFVRVRVGTTTALPTTELNDPNLVTVQYPGSGTDEGQKLSNIESLGLFSDNLASLPRAERQAQVVTQALNLPGVTKAGVSSLSGNVWIQYADGDYSLLMDNRDPPPGGIVELPEPEPVPLPRLPRSLDAVCGYSTDFFMPDSTKLVNSWLRKAGYQSIATNVVTVDKLLGWQNLGVFFWEAHCGSIPLDPNDLNSKHVMGIMTAQRVSVELSQGRFKAMRDSRELVIARPQIEFPWPDGVIPAPFYAVSGSFIRNKMRFADRSLVVIDGCTSGAQELAEAFLAANAGAYVGWSQPVCELAGTPMRQLFDRLLGANAEAPISSPKERPFSLPIVQDWLRSKGLDYDPGPCNGYHGRLQWYFASNPASGPAKSTRILLPTIYRVLYEARDPTHDFTKFLIEGDFDKDFDPSQRVVTWGDQVLTVLEWHDDSILVRPPPPPYPVGDIQVIMGNRRSNAVPMTEWTMPFTYTLTGQGSLQYVIELTVKLRGDARGSREMPQEPLSGVTRPMWELADCTGTVSASGQYKPNPDTTITWSGGNSIKSSATSFSEITASGGISFTGSRIEGFSLSAIGSFTVTTNGRSSPAPATLDGFLGFVFPPWNRPFSPVDFTLPADSMIAPFPPTTTEHALSARISWPAATVQAVPTNQTPR